MDGLWLAIVHAFAWLLLLLADLVDLAPIKKNTSISTFVRT
jgi:hypothetical protein